MSESEYIHFEHHGVPFLNVSVYEHPGVDRRGAEVQRFRADAKARLVPGMAMSGGADEVPLGVAAPLFSFYFEPEHLAVSEEILDWLRLHPLVRLIEIERYLAVPASRPPR